MTSLRFLVSIIIMLLFAPVGLLGEENHVYGIKYWCNENVLVCNGDETDDEITGGDNNNIIYGWTGNDYLRGMAGDDVILGGEGADTIIGDTSSDVFDE